MQSQTASGGIDQQSFGNQAFSKDCLHVGARCSLGQLAALGVLLPLGLWSAIWAAVSSIPSTVW